jgi:glycosyltransferase involved in cell wall biosynthesis
MLQSKGATFLQKPVVSVIIIVRNGAEFIACAIDSVLSQEFDRPFELIVVDDGSTDETIRIVERYGERISLIRNEWSGISRSRNSGIFAARGEFIAFIDADDTWAPDKLARTVEALETEAEAVAAYTDAFCTDVDGTIVRESFVPPKHRRAPSMQDLLREYWHVLPSTIVIRRSALRRIGGFCEAFGRVHSGEDVYCWLRLREYGRFVYLDERLTNYVLPQAPQRLVRRAIEIGQRGNPEKSVKDERFLAELIRGRYGAAGVTLMRERRKSQAQALGALGLAAMSVGEDVIARRCYLAALRFRPFDARSMMRLAISMLPGRAIRALHCLLPLRLARTFFGPAQA